MKRAELFFILTATLFSLSLAACKFHEPQPVITVSSEQSEPEPKNFLLTYLPNGAEGEIFEEEILSGTSFKIKNNFYEIPLDKKFAYWNTRRDGRGTSYSEGEEIKMPRYDLYLFARWIDSDAFSIVYKNCENADNTENPGEFTSSDNITLKPATKTGYIFDGWFLEEDFSDDGITGWEAGERNSSIIIYAKWTPEKRSVTYKAGIGEGLDFSFEVDYNEVLTLEEFLFKAPKNKKFTVWNIDGTCYKAGHTYGPVQTDLVFTAEYDYFVRGDVSKNYIEINDIAFENTAEVCVVPPLSFGYIEGSDSLWTPYIWQDDHADFKGAFIDGRNVSLSPYAVSKYMVTRELFTAVFGKLPSGDSKVTAPEENGDLVAAGGISWYTAIAFCNKLTLLTGGTTEDLVYYVEGVDWQTLSLEEIPTRVTTEWSNAVCDLTKPGYRLLTEAEWEFAARGGDTAQKEFYYAYPGFDTSKTITYSKEEGDVLELAGPEYQYKFASKTTALDNWSLCIDDATTEYAWLMNNSENKAHQTGLKKPNSLGIYDMAGNLWEWIWDYYSESPTNSDVPNEDNVVENPMGPETGKYRIRKGCNYMDEYGMSVKAISSYRGERMEENKTGANYGIRIGRSLVD